MLQLTSLQISEFYIYNEKIQCEEDKYVEFKFIPKENIPHQSISFYLKTYLNAFLNTQGGSIYFGIQDNQIIKGVKLNAKERDYIRLSVDQYCNQYVPQVDEDLTEVKFIPVKFKENDPDKDDDIYVVVINIKQGNQPIYFTNWKHDSAYIRRNAGITKMSQETIIERLIQGRQYQTGQYLNILGRQAIVDKCIQFVNDKQHATKVIILYGLMSVGKSSISEYIKQQLMQQFQNSITLKIDLKQQTNLKDSLLFLIKSINPLYDLNQIIDQQKEPESTPSLSNTFNMLYKPTNIEQQLLNIYTNLVKQQNKVILQIENVHKKCLFTEQLIPYGTQTIAILTARKVQQLYFLGPQVGVLQQQILPLTEKETAMILVNALPSQINLEQAQMIAKLTGGLPLVIRYIIIKCQIERCNPNVIIQDLNSLKPDQLTKKVCPQVYSLLQQISQQHLIILQYLSLSNIFSSQFIDYIQLYINNLTKEEFTKQVDDIIEMGLIQKIQVQSLNLNNQNWYLITDIIRSYIIHHMDEQTIKQCILVFNNFYLEQLKEINKQVQFYSQSSQNPQQKSQVNIYLDLFLTLEQNYEYVLNLIFYQLEHTQLFDQKLSLDYIAEIIDQLTPVLKFMTQNAKSKYDKLVDVKIGKYQVSSNNENDKEWQTIEKCVFL